MGGEEGGEIIARLSAPLLIFSRASMVSGGGGGVPAWWCLPHFRGFGISALLSLPAYYSYHFYYFNNLLASLSIDHIFQNHPDDALIILIRPYLSSSRLLIDKVRAFDNLDNTKPVGRLADDPYVNPQLPYLLY